MHPAAPHASSGTRLHDSFGVVEGFYWKKEDTHNGQYGEYTHAQRRKLLMFMAAKGLNVYVYDPKVVRDKPTGRQERAIELLKDESLKEWRETFKLAKALKIEFIWGITSPNLNSDTIKKVELVIRQLIHPENGADGIAFLFDDTTTLREITHQAKFVHDLCVVFPSRIKAYCAPCYSGEPRNLEQQLQEVDRTIPKEVPFVFTGKAVWNKSIKQEDLPIFENRKIVLWDNWIAGDSLELAKLTVIPPLDRESQLLKQIGGYWLNLAFPLERVIPAVSSIAFLQLNKCSPQIDGLPGMLLEEGGVADEWSTEMGCFAHWTKLILQIKLKNRDAVINPNLEDIFEHSDLHSLNLLLKEGLKKNAPVKTGKTLMQLAIDHHNYPVARFLHARGLDDGHVNWAALKKAWKEVFKQPVLTARILKFYEPDERHWNIIDSVDTYNLISLQYHLQNGLSARTINSKGKSLTEIAQWHQYSDLVEYLKPLAEIEEETQAAHK